MTNALAVCLTIAIFYTSLSSARQIPKECSKGPEYWCTNLKTAADCGAVGHCISTVWENEDEKIRDNDASEKIVRLFRQLKDVKELINEDYLASRVTSACRDISNADVSRLCKHNTNGLEKYLSHVLLSKTSADTMCRIVGMCNNEKVDSFLSMKKKNTPATHIEKKPSLVGASKCTWGPSYWCSNFSTGRECNATPHCVQRVWSKMELPRDEDSICKICKDMVTQARDQLQSNETQEELKEVFEGECKLIPIKLVTRECIKLADEFVPELVETLSSEMNPDQVCSVAGLCNNARIDRLLEDYSATMRLHESCSNCHKTIGILRKRFEETSYEDFLVSLLQICRNVGSLSDSCSMLVFKYYENIVEALKKDFTPGDVCHINGQCSLLQHSHDLYVYPEDQQAELKATDDVPCEFCEQVVNHMRDTLVANTSEVEFHKVLTGLCKHTGNFKSECLQLVEQYHSTVYYYLVSELKADKICRLIGICGDRVVVPVAPLLPRELAVKAVTLPNKLIGQDEANSYIKPEVTPAPLPIERMFVRLPATTQNEAVCSFCQYFLHYIQVELSDDHTEDAIKKAVQSACDVLPESVEGECRQFVSEYGDSVIALLVQQIDPASICPGLGLCPKTEEVHQVQIKSDHSNCPLCLFAVEQLEIMLKDNRSEVSIRNALSGLCSHLSAKLRTQCVDFVDTYTNQLIEMLIADLNAQEICVYLKLCQDNVNKTNPLNLKPIDKYHEKPALRGDRNNIRRPMLPAHMLDVSARYDIETNQIPDNTVNGRVVKESAASTVCVICEFVLKEIDDQIKDKHNDDEIKKIVHGVCKRMPKSVRSECDQFVEKYSDLVISLLAQELNPDEVCQELKLCKSVNFNAVKEEILDCAVCETVVMALKKVLSNDKMDRNIVHIVERACDMLPAKYYNRCHTMLEIYGEGIIHLIEDFGTKGICQKIGLCAGSAYVDMQHEHMSN
ncbi:uncharacterized protein LOC126965511 isoform X2 [Leptidea sinapis]|uniref:uncharacterized protein LOC126965511 isoform X2 n=1 Tax=Leptidea sinapis TaxID=189913 RepID=UPI0021C2BCE8|nr:uncharacterized protein LOC126965511 isoform X2 [Leptidea sinapis]